MQTRSKLFADIVKDFQEGDKEAFSELMPLVAPMVNAIVRRFWGHGRSGIGKEDLLQEAWMSVYHALDKYDVAVYPEICHQFLRNAIVARLLDVDRHTHLLGVARPLKRFLSDVLADRVDWTLSNAKLAESYSGVALDDIAWARYDGGAERWDVAVVDWLGGGTGERGSLRGIGQARAVESAMDTEFIDDQVSEFLESFVGQMDEFERRVFELRFLKGFTRVEVSVAVERSLDALGRVERGIFAKCPGGCRLSPGEVWRQVWYNH